MINNKNKKWI